MALRADLIGMIERSDGPGSAHTTAVAESSRTSDGAFVDHRRNMELIAERVLPAVRGGMSPVKVAP